MNISTLPDKAKVFIDSNIFIYHFAGISEQCSTIINRIESKKLEAYVSNIVIGEIIIAEAMEKEIVTPQNLFKKLKNNPY